MKTRALSGRVALLTAVAGIVLMAVSGFLFFAALGFSLAANPNLP